LDNVREEAIYNVRRLNHHPSLALWAGGNELESLVLRSAQAQDPTNAGYYLQIYEELFIKTLLPVVYQSSRSISFTPTSTGNGYIYLNHSTYTMIERYDNKTPGSIYGDTDYYNYDSSVSFNLSSYPVGRFANEFGFHSMPSVQTWEQVMSEDQMSFNSSIVLVHSNHYPPADLSTTNRTNALRGAGEMTVAVERYYPIPRAQNPVTKFSDWCHTTQIFQADFYKSQISFYRRGSGMPERQLGSLYWQLEDIWQAPTWAGIEYDGRWKVLHYMAKDIYNHVIIAPYYNITTGDLTVYVTSDLWTPASGTARLEWYDWSGKIIGNASTVGFEVGALNTTRVMETNIKNGSVMANAVLVMKVSASGKLPNSDQTQNFTHENWFHATPLNAVSLQDPQIELSYDDSTAEWSVSSKTVAPWVWLDFPAGVLGNFEENAFWLIPGETRKVGFTEKSATDGTWKDAVTVRSLWNNTLS